VVSFTRLYSRRNVFGTHSIGGRVDPRTVLHKRTRNSGQNKRYPRSRWKRYTDMYRFVLAFWRLCPVVHVLRILATALVWVFHEHNSSSTLCTSEVRGSSDLLLPSVGRYALCCLLLIKYHSGDQEEWDGRGMWHVWGTREVYRRFWWGDLREGDYLEDLGVDGRIVLTL
jgi:hypothetical protein